MKQTVPLRDLTACQQQLKQQLYSSKNTINYKLYILYKENNKTT